MKKGLILGSIIAVFIGLIGFFMYFSSSNKEIDIRNRAMAQQKVCESYFDKMWKVISQTAQVAEQYKESFSKIYPDLISGRYKNERGGALMSWVTEANPNFSTALYEKLVNQIEAQREGFFNEQEKLIDLNREHSNILMQFPSSVFVGGREKLQITVITSDKTDAVFKSGKDNDVDLFKK